MTRIFRCTIAAAMLLVANVATAQRPVATLPTGITISGGAYVGTVMDTTYSLPTGGTTWTVHNSTQLSTALSGSQPGDVIVLDAQGPTSSIVFNGAFQLPQKANPSNKWIYIISAGLVNLPSGTTVDPVDNPSQLQYFAKIVTPNTAPAMQVNWGANYFRLAGVELTTASNYPTGCGTDPAAHCMTYFLMGSQWAQSYAQPNHLVCDRCYLHGAPTFDLQSGWMMNADYAAIVDSRVSDVHIKGFDSQAVGAFNSHGPIKIVDNYLSGAGENVLFGGSGQNYNVGVISDIEVRNNYLYKPLSWVPFSMAPGNATSDGLVEKNAFELKNGQRVLVDNNIIQNVWAAGQSGYAIVLTVRSSQSGDFAVVNDITITNNQLLNVVAGVNTLAKDDQCAPATYPNCHNAGSQDRWYIVNNLIKFWDQTQPGSNRNLAISFQGGYDYQATIPTHGIIRDIVFQHNTMIPAAGQQCWFPGYFGGDGVPTPYPPTEGLSNNIWILDNEMCGQPSGDNGYTGNGALSAYMNLPSTSPYDQTHRYVGNAMYVAPGNTVKTWPANNLATTTPFTFDSNWQLLTPSMTGMTSDGNQAGYSTTGMTAPPTYSLTVTVTGPCAVGTPLALTGTATQSGTTDSTGTYVFQGLANGSYTVTPTPPTCTVTPTSQSVTIASANGATSFVTAPLYFTMSGSVTGPAAVATTITLTGPSPTVTTTDTNGNFTASGLLAGTYTVTPNQGQFQFSPANQSVVVSTTNVTGINFVSTPPPQYSISGTITGAGVGTMIYVIGATGAPVGTTTTTMNGSFAFGALFVNGTYMIRPSSSCNSFTPPTQTVTVSGANLTGVNFTAY